MELGSSIHLGSEMRNKSGMFEEDPCAAGMFSSGSPSNPWNISCSESFYGGSTPPGLSSDSSFAETESSEDDDFTAGLAEQMAHSMLDDSDDNIDSSGTEVDSLDRARLWGDFGWTVNESEQPIKSNWSTGYWSSGYSSSSSKVSSPPSTPGAADDGWDSPELSRFYTDEKADKTSTAYNHLPEVQWKNGSRSGALPILTKPYAAAVNPRRGWNQKEDERGSRSQCRSSNKQPAPVAWNSRAQQQQAQPPPCMPAGTPRSVYRVGARTLGHWQGVPPANGSVMRAVFLGGSSDRSSSGTGVFLPRSSNDYTNKRKTSCSSVLLPSRIVQVLNLNIDNEMRCYPSVNTVPSAVPGNAGGESVVGEECSSQWKTYSTCSQLHQPAPPETSLPEWSY